MSIKKFLDILDGKQQLNEDISECGEMPMSSATPPLTMNLNLSAQGINNIKDVLNLINMTDRTPVEQPTEPMSMPTVTPGPLSVSSNEPNQPDELQDIVKKAGLPVQASADDNKPEDEGVMGALGGGALGGALGGPMGALTGAAAGSSLQNTIDGDETEESFSNEPEESYQDQDYMIKDLAGGLNKPHKQFRKGYPGADNAMSIHKETVDTIKDRLLKEYSEFVTEWDPSDYRPGDEKDPRSPWWNDDDDEESEYNTAAYHNDDGLDDEYGFDESCDKEEDDDEGKLADFL